MSTFFGYFFIVIGFAAAVFFITYSGEAIASKELFIVFSIFFIIIGGFLIVQQKFETFRQNFAGGQLAARNNQLIKKGEKLRVTLNNCEIKEETKGSLTQSYLVFTKQYQNQLYTFTSQPAKETAAVLRKYLQDNDGIDLYIDRQDPHHYYFDIYS